MTMWPNTSLEPTPVTLVSFRCGFRVGGSHRRVAQFLVVRLHCEYGKFIAIKKQVAALSTFDSGSFFHIFFHPPILY